MKMNLGEMLDRVYDVLGDVRDSPRQFPRAKIVELVNEGQMVFRRFVEDEWFRTTQDLVAAQGVYTFTDQSLRAIRVAFEDVTLEPTTVQELQELDSRWQTRTRQRPRRWTTQQQPHNKYRIYPIPTTSTVGSYDVVGDPNYTPAPWNADHGEVARWQNADGSNVTFVEDRSGEQLSDVILSDIADSFVTDVSSILESEGILVPDVVVAHVADDDTVAYGADNPFDTIRVIMALGITDILPVFTYGDGPSTWTVFAPTDGTSGLTVSGDITFDAQALLDAGTPWVKTTVAGKLKYWIRVQRTENTVPVPPIVQRVALRLLNADPISWLGKGVDAGIIGYAPPLSFQQETGELGQIQASGVGNLTLWLVKIPPTLTDDGEELSVKAAFQTAVLFYALWQTYEEEGDHHNPIVAAFYRDEFRRIVERARELAANPLPYMVQKLGSSGFGLHGENAALPFNHTGLDDEGNTVNFGWPRGF